MNEVHFFLNDEKNEDLSHKKLKYKLFASKQEKIPYLGRFNQLILFLHRLQSKYFTRLDLKQFPEGYRLNIKRILQFLSKFELHRYENSFFLISTHIQDLKSVSNGQVSNYYIDCELIDDKPTFTYKLKKGWSNIKVGRLLFDKEGLNKLLK